MRGLGWQVTTMNERYGPVPGEKISDEHWIREAADAGEAMLCKDAHVAKRPLEAEAIAFSSGRVFVLSSGTITGPAMADRVVKHSSAIERWIDNVDGPFVCGIYDWGLRRLHLNWP